MTCDICGKPITEQQQRNGYFHVGEAWNKYIESYKTPPRHSQCNLVGIFLDMKKVGIEVNVK